MIKKKQSAPTLKGKNKIVPAEQNKKGKYLKKVVDKSNFKWYSNKAVAKSSWLRLRTEKNKIKKWLTTCGERDILIWLSRKTTNRTLIIEQ